MCLPVELDEMGQVPTLNLSELAAEYDEKRRMEPADFQRLLDLIFHYGRPAGQILEVGCGTGFYLIPLARQLPDARCYGLDIALAMLTQAQAKARKFGLSNCLLARADAHYLPFKGQSFEFVLLSQVLHYFQDRSRVAWDISQLCKPGGRLLVITTSHPQLRSQIDLALFPGIIKREMARMPDLEEIRLLFAGHGFQLFATVEFAASFRFSSPEVLAQWVARKPWSSYLLFSEPDFRRRLKAFQRNLSRAFGEGEIVYLVPQTLLFFRKL